MSTIIDQIIFQKPQQFDAQVEPMQEPDLIYQISKKLRINQNSIVVKNNQKLLQTRGLVDHPDKSFIVKFQIYKNIRYTTFSAVLLEQFEYQRVGSKQNEILLIKELFKRHKQFPVQSNLYMNNGQVVMIMNNFLALTKNIKHSKVVQVYNQFIMNNLMNFDAFMQKYIIKTVKTPVQLQKLSQFHKQLQIAKILNSTHSTSDISAEKSQFKYANLSLQKQKEQLVCIQKHITQQHNYERPINRLFHLVAEEISSDWLAQHLIPVFQTNYKKFKTLLNLVKPSGDKRVEDFVFNMAKIEIKEMLSNNRPIGEGGSSFIFAARADITFISSIDLELSPKNIEKVQRVIAFKKLKAGEQKKSRNKLVHQKQIVTRMRGSVCQFIPKYFGTENESELSNTLVMEMVQGQQLDFYISSRAETISLWSKIYLLLNVIHGMRHLINYQIVHLDLKPINILVCKNLITKIIDFGEAHHTQFCPANYIPGFTFPYVAPEVYLRFLKHSFNRPDDLRYSEKQDVFAFGIIMCEVIFDSRIFTLGNNKYKEVYAKREILQRFMLAPERAQEYGDEVIMGTILYLIVRCVDPDPNNRPCFEWIGICLKLILNSYININ